MDKNEFFEIVSSVFNLEKTVDKILKNSEHLKQNEIDGCKAMLSCLKEMKNNFKFFAN